jgi:hypothetical protein
MTGAKYGARKLSGLSQTKLFVSGEVSYVGGCAVSKEYQVCPQLYKPSHTFHNSEPSSQWFLFAVSVTAFRACDLS